MARLTPWLRRHGIGPVVGLSLTVSLGSSRAGAAILASALDEGRLDRRAALWGTLALAFPAYLRRWPATFALCVSMAGGAGAVFAVVLLLRSAARFALTLVLERSAYKDMKKLQRKNLDIFRRFLFLLRLIFCVYFALKTHDSFEQKIRMKSKKTFIQSFLFFTITAAIIAYFFPREGKFPYQFHEGKPWRYDLLTAPNDFPIYKSDQEIKAENYSDRKSVV